MALIVDTSVVVALLDADDRHHSACLAMVESSDDVLLLPSPTLAEIDYWIRKRMDVSVWQSFIADLAAGAYLLENPTRHDVDRAVELELQYRDLGLGFVDASIIAICERLK